MSDNNHVVQEVIEDRKEESREYAVEEGEKVVAAGLSSEEEEEVIDLTENPMYQVLSQLLENQKGENICDVLTRLVVSVEKNTLCLQKLVAASTKQV